MTVSVGIVVWCDGDDRNGSTARCGRLFESSGDTCTAARWQARQTGWTERNGLDYCPAHSDAGAGDSGSTQRREMI